MRLRLILAAALAVALGGCLHPIDRTNAPAFGDAVAAMISAQTDDAPPNLEPPVGSGAVAAAGVGRYQAGQTRPLIIDSTSSLGTSD